MAAFKGSTFKDRAEAAADAKKALLEAFKARPSIDDPAYKARMEQRKAVAEAREQRATERARFKEEEEKRLKVETAARKLAEAEDSARKAAESQARDEHIRNGRKAARDARYAARKARRGK